MTTARPKPRVIFINGIHTQYLGARSTAFEKLAPIIQHTWYADSIITVFIYNPTFSVQWPDWDQRHKCAYSTLRAAAVNALAAVGVDGVAIAVKYAVCRGYKVLNEVTQNDLVESAIEVLDLQNLGGLAVPEPAFVGFLADAGQWFHDRGIPTIFVPHSQGNLMLAQALAKRQFNPSLTPSAHVCTAATSLAPRNPSDFTQYSWMHWNGFILNHDILTLFGMNTGVDHLRSKMSDDFENYFVSAGLYHPSIAIQWGINIHSISNYLGDRVDAFQERIRPMIDVCYQTLIQ